MSSNPQHETGDQVNIRRSHESPEQHTDVNQSSTSTHVTNINQTGSVVIITAVIALILGAVAWSLMNKQPDLSSGIAIAVKQTIAAKPTDTPIAVIAPLSTPTIDPTAIAAIATAQQVDTQSKITSTPTHPVERLETPSPTPNPPTDTPEPTVTPTHTPEPTATQTPFYLFNDDFSDSKESKLKWTTMAGLWEIENGMYFIDMGGNNKNGFSLAGDTQWRDYTYSVDVMLKQGIDIYVIFRYLDERNVYQIHLRCEEFNDLILLKGLPPHNGVLQSASFGCSKENWYSIKIVGLHNTIRVYVNDTMYLNYFDDSAPVLSGRIGVGVWTGAAGRTANYFDNVRVTPLDQ